VSQVLLHLLTVFIIHLFLETYTLRICQVTHLPKRILLNGTPQHLFHVPKHLVGKGKIPQLRADFVKAIGRGKGFGCTNLAKPQGLCAI
jgi:hypothetical protein